jgi:hypothetical protein
MAATGQEPAPRDAPKSAAEGCLQTLSSGTALIERGTPAFRRTNLALFAAGFAAFALLYGVQLAGGFRPRPAVFEQMPVFGQAISVMIPLALLTFNKLQWQASFEFFGEMAQQASRNGALVRP